MNRSVVAALGIVALVAGIVTGTGDIAASTAADPSAILAGTTPTVPLRVAKSVIVDPSGKAVRFRGVNRSGSEYECQQGGGVFDGPTDQASIDLLRSWNVNMVRIPLNEHCWLGIDWAPATTGAPYQSAVKAYVDQLAANGIYAVLDLHFTGPTAIWGEQDEVMANTTYSLPFWTSVASMFRGSNSVLFEPYNEPYGISTSCWLNGCTTSQGWQAAGYQQLVDTIRATGATQPIVVNGLDWGHDMSPMLTSMPTDPAKALVAGQHLYNFKSCVTASCWNQQFAPVAAKYPMIATEVGVNDCSSTMPAAFMDWMDAHGGDGYAFWNFGVTGCPDGSAYGGSALISDASGTPTSYGQTVQSHFLAAGTTNTPTPPPTTPPPSSPPTTPAAPCTANQYAGAYYTNPTLNGVAAVTTCEDLVNHSWGTAAPVAGIPADGFSARWTRTLSVGGGSYRFSITGDDGIRLYLDDQLVLNGWKDQGATTYTTTMPLSAGSHALRLEYYDRTGSATAKLSWTRAG